MNKAVPLAGLTLALAACATAPGARNTPAPEAAGTPSTISAPPADTRSLIVDGATAMLGQPYRYGGAAPGGFDCSGLVVYATVRAGIRLPRTAQAQMQAGSQVARRELKSGDLVFMHLRRKELHVGIAIDNARFVHAPAAGGRVRIDSLDAPAYAHSYLTARRIVHDSSTR